MTVAEIDYVFPQHIQRDVDDSGRDGCRGIFDGLFIMHLRLTEGKGIAVIFIQNISRRGRCLDEIVGTVGQSCDRDDAVVFGCVGAD